MQRPGPRSRQMNRDPLTAKVSRPVSSWLNFSPLSLVPALWLDASDSSSIIASGNAVSQWNDKSGNNFHFTQANAANQPTTGTRTVNGLNAIDFDGSDDNMSAGDVIDLGTNNLTTFIVAQCDTFTAGGRTLIGKYKVSPVAGSYVMINENFVQRTYYIGPTTGATLISNSSTTVPFIQSTVIDRSAGSMGMWLNKVLFNSATFTADSGTSRDIPTHLYLGALRNSSDSGFQPGNFMDGMICEIIFVLRALTSSEVNLTENYLRAKWATP